MSNSKEYVWIINQIDCEDLGGVDNFVNTVHWSYKVIQGKNEATINGATGFTHDPRNRSYVPFDEIQKANVIAWLESTLDLEELQNVLTNELKQCKRIINSITNPFENENQQPWTESN